MITKQKALIYTTEDGQEHKTLKDAMKHELRELVADGVHDLTDHVAGAAEWIVANKEKVIAVIQSSGRRPRKLKGKATKPVTPKKPKAVRVEGTEVTA